jgi:putative hydrolase of the HAD superfamily
MSVPMFRHIERFAFFRLFTGKVISGAVKFVKPELAIYEHLVQRFGLAPAETVFIDDLAANVTAARDAGLAAIQFEDAAQCERDLEALLAR